MALIDRAVELVRTALEDQVRNRSGPVAILGCVVVLNNDNFFLGFDVLRLETLPVNPGIVVILAFNKEFVGPRAAATDSKVDAVAETTLLSIGHTRKCQSKRIGVETAERKGLNFFSADVPADLRVIRVHRDSVRNHLNLL